LEIVSMNDSTTTTPPADTALEDFAAELAEAAYPVALRRGLGSRWLDLELGLWRALQDTVAKWDRQALLPHAAGK
jgi:hypothetical protein